MIFAIPELKKTQDIFRMSQKKNKDRMKKLAWSIRFSR